VKVNLTYCAYSLSIFKENILSSLSQQQKKIAIVALAAFACLAALYLTRNYYFKAQVQSNTNDDQSQNQKIKSAVATEQNTEKVEPPKPSEPAHEEKIKAVQPEKQSPKETDLSEEVDNLAAFDPITETRKNEFGDEERGIFVDGKLIRGRKTTNQGEISEGEFKDGELHGKGKKLCFDKTLFEGEFKEGQLDGQGKITLPNGYIFEGEFKNNSLIKGKVIDCNGFITEGEFKKGAIFNGTGKVFFADNRTEEGVFKNGQLIRGIITKPLNDSFESAERYQGEFEGGKLKQGKKWAGGVMIDGKFDYSNTTLEEGEFKGDQLNGQGKKTFPGSQIHVGSFKDGKLDIQRKINEDVIKWMREGTFVDGCLHGQGTYIYHNGIIEEGEFQNDHFAKGTRTYPNGHIEEVDVDLTIDLFS
jgi:hypothetical protein